jgi:hypothetical protein
MKRIEQGRVQDVPSSSPTTAVLSDEAIDQLHKIADLKEKGILTWDEFDAQKQKLLST